MRLELHITQEEDCWIAYCFDPDRSEPSVRGLAPTESAAAKEAVRRYFQRAADPRWLATSQEAP